MFKRTFFSFFSLLFLFSISFADIIPTSNVNPLGINRTPHKHFFKKDNSSSNDGYYAGIVNNSHFHLIHTDNITNITSIDATNSHNGNFNPDLYSYNISDNIPSWSTFRVHSYLNSSNQCYDFIFRNNSLDTPYTPINRCINCIEFVNDAGGLYQFYIDGNHDVKVSAYKVYQTISLPNNDIAIDIIAKVRSTEYFSKMDIIIKGNKGYYYVYAEPSDFSSYCNSLVFDDPILIYSFDIHNSNRFSTPSIKYNHNNLYFAFHGPKENSANDLTCSYVKKLHYSHSVHSFLVANIYTSQLNENAQRVGFYFPLLTEVNSDKLMIFEMLLRPYSTDDYYPIESACPNNLFYRSINTTNDSYSQTTATSCTTNNFSLSEEEEPVVMYHAMNYASPNCTHMGVGFTRVTNIFKNIPQLSDEAKRYINTDNPTQDQTAALPTSAKIVSATPNPFNPSTTATIALPNAGVTKLAVYNVLGQKVRTLVHGEIEAGNHSFVWNGLSDAGTQVSSGVYYLILQSGNTVAKQKIVLMK